MQAHKTRPGFVIAGAIAALVAITLAFGGAAAL